MLPAHPASVIAAAEAVFPSLASYPEHERARFVTFLAHYQRWVAAPPRERAPVVNAAAIELGTTTRAVERRFRHVLRTQSFEGLLKRSRADRGRARAFDEPVLAHLVAVYRSNPNKREAYRETLRVFAGTQYRIGSYRAACSIITAWEEEHRAEMSLARKSKSYYDTQEVPILRDKTRLQPMEIICGDHHQFDVVVIWPNGEIVRPWVSAWVDVRTNYWVGFTVCRTPDARSIADSLYHVIRRFGIPQNVYIDNGKAYRARVLKGVRFQDDELGRIDLPQDAQKMLSVLQDGLYGQSTVRHALPYNSRAKVVERMFGIGGFADWAKTLPGYTGNRYEQMPDETRRRIKSRRLMRLDDFVVRLLHHIDEFHQRESRGHGMGGASPRQVFAWYLQHGWRPTMPPDPHMLDLMAMHSATRVVQRFGIQHSSAAGDPMYYYDEELRKYIGRKVLIKWADSDRVIRRVFSVESDDGHTYRAVPARLLVYSEEGRFICEAPPLERAEYLDDPDIAERIATQRRHRKEIKQSIAESEGFREYISGGGGLDADAATVEESKPLRVVRVDNRSEFEKRLSEARSARSARDMLGEYIKPSDDEEIIDL